MADRLLLATRKGLFVLTRTGSSSQPWRLSQTSFLGDSLSMILVDPRDGAWYAALGLGHFGAKLRRSDDQGTTWEELSVPSYPADATLPANPMMPPDSPRGRERPATLLEFWSLEIGAPDARGTLWAGTIPGGLFHSADRGTTWELNRPLWDQPERLQWFGGGKDEPGIHSICVDPRDPRHVTVGVSCGGVWTTRDGGGSWSCVATGMRAGYMPPELQHLPPIQDPHRVVQCAADPEWFWTQHHSGIFYSSNGCQQWQECEGVDPSSFGFAVVVHPRDPRTAWFVPATKDEVRVPVDGRLVVTRTRDGGQSFERLTQGLPTTPCYDLIYRHALDIDASGAQLAFGSTNGGVWTSDDGGEHWTCLDARLPPVHAVRFG